MRRFITPIRQCRRWQSTYNYTNSSDKYNFQSPRNMNSQVSCTVLGSQGNVTAISKKFPRHVFLQDTGLHPRDLRNISSAKVSIIPAIMVRSNSVLVNLLELQAVIKRNEVLILDENQQAKKLGVLLYDLENKLATKEPLIVKENGGSIPYELRALESILMNAVSSLEVELKSQISGLNKILHHLEDHVDRDLLKDLLIKSKSVSQFLQKTKLVRDVLNDVLDSDEDMSAMYLTDRYNGVVRHDEDHAEVELLLEAYYKQLDEIVRQAERVMTNVRTTEEITNIMLDANRNSLMLMELKITIGTLGFTVGMFFAALYGMNLENFIEESPYGFIGVTALITAVSVLVSIYNYKKLEIVKRVAMLTKRKPSKRRSEWHWLTNR